MLNLEYEYSFAGRPSFSLKRHNCESARNRATAEMERENKRSMHSLNRNKVQRNGVSATESPAERLNLYSLL